MFSHLTISKFVKLQDIPFWPRALNLKYTTVDSVLTVKKIQTSWNTIGLLWLCKTPSVSCKTLHWRPFYMRQRKISAYSDLPLRAFNRLSPPLPFFMIPIDFWCFYYCDFFKCVLFVTWKFELRPKILVTEYFYESKCKIEKGKCVRISRGGTSRCNQYHGTL